ncbi:MAG TPA: fumarate hydratase, partial [Acidimicrobiia bacterium]|nr:fumarate hydratase [Acidimicrobiia bacterium]
MVEFAYQELLPIGADETPYRQLTTQHVSTFTAGGRRFLQVEPEALTLLTQRAMFDIAHLLRPGHLAQLRAILDDPEASANDRFVALELLKNACIAAGGVLPSCQDTGTAIVKAKKGELVLTGGGDRDREAIARGIFRTYAEDNLRYSQLAPLTTFDEQNTGTNLPAEIEIEAVDGDAYDTSSLFALASTAAVFSPSLKDQFLERFPNLVVSDAVGASETGANGHIQVVRGHTAMKG